MSRRDEIYREQRDAILAAHEHLLTAVSNGTLAEVELARQAVFLLVDATLETPIYYPYGGSQ